MTQSKPTGDHQSGTDHQLPASSVVLSFACSACNRGWTGDFTGWLCTCGATARVTDRYVEMPLR